MDRRIARRSLAAPTLQSGRAAMTSCQKIEMTERKRSDVIGSAGVVLALVAFLGGGCDKGDEIRSTLETDRAAWDRQVAALRTNVSDLEARFQALPPAPTKGEGAVAAQAQRRRIQASIIGTKQTLFDIQSHIAASVGEVEEGIRQGDDQGNQALNGVAGRVNEYLRQQQQSVAVTQDAMTRMRGETRP